MPHQISKERIAELKDWSDNGVLSPRHRALLHDLLAALEAATAEVLSERDARDKLDRALRSKEQAMGVLMSRMSPEQLENLIP